MNADKLGKGILYSLVGTYLLYTAKFPFGSGILHGISLSIIISVFSYILVLGMANIASSLFSIVGVDRNAKRKI